MFTRNNLYFLLLKKCKLVLLCLALFIVPVYALKYSWKDDKVYAEGTYVFGENNNQFNVYLEIIENDWDEKVVALVLRNDECIEGEEQSKVFSVAVDGASIPMIERCIDKDVAMIFPKTEAGIEYVIRELETRRAVKYKWVVDNKKVVFVFSAKGFEKAYDEYEPEDEDEEEDM